MTWPNFSYDIYENFEDASLASGLSLTDPDGKVTLPSTDFYKDGSNCLKIDCSGSGEWGSKIEYYCDVENVSFGLWYKTATMDSSFRLATVCTAKNYSFAYQIQLIEELDWSNNRGFAVNFFDETFIPCTDNTWYWITCRYRKDIGGEVNIYNEVRELLGTLTITNANTTNCALLQIGQVYSSDHRDNTYIYVDGYVIDFTSASFPLLGWETVTYTEASSSISGLGDIIGPKLSIIYPLNTSIIGAGEIGNVSIKRLYELAGNSVQSDYGEYMLDSLIYNDLSLKEAIKILLAVNAGKSTGGGTSSIKFRDINDTKDKISAVVDQNGNRSNITILKD